MEITKNNWDFKGFLLKNVHFFILGTGLISLLALLFPIIKFVDGEIVVKMNLISYFVFKNSFDWLIIPTIIFLLMGTVFGFLFKKNKYFISLSAIGFLLGTLFVVLSRSFFTANYLDVSDLRFGLGAYLSIAFGLISIALSFSIYNSYSPMSVRDIAEEGILIASAFVLDFVKIPMGATGGSINLQMLPLMIIALRKGPMHALFSAGVVYGLLTCFSDGYGLFTFPFDYLIGFGSVATLGFFQKFIFSETQTNYNWKGILFIALGSIPVFIVRMIGGMSSSMILYGADFAFSFGYNIVYIGPSVLFSTLALIGLYGPLIKINSIFPSKN